jgi:Tfx family DNA-binding protein
LGRSEDFHSTILTKRQWEVLRYRAEGLTQRQVAMKLGTSREDVSEIEHRVLRKISAAKATLVAMQNLRATGEVLLPTGTSIFEAVSMIILRADILEIKLSSSGDDMLASVRSKCRSKIRGHHLISPVTAIIERDGSFSLKTD